MPRHRPSPGLALARRHSELAWNAMKISRHRNELLLTWSDKATLHRTFWFRICPTCRFGFWRKATRCGRPEGYCCAQHRLVARRKSKQKYMRKVRYFGPDHLPHHRYMTVVGRRLVPLRGPGGNQSRNDRSRWRPPRRVCSRSLAPLRGPRRGLRVHPVPAKPCAARASEPLSMSCP
jgi:hypothetical protein